MSLARSQDTRAAYKNQSDFYILSMNTWSLKFKNTLPFTITQKNLHINLIKHIYDLLAENHKKLMKERRPK